jgi:hypothetical protein
MPIAVPRAAGSAPPYARKSTQLDAVGAHASAEDFASPADTIPAIPAMTSPPSTDAVVRFRAPSSPPAAKDKEPSVPPLIPPRTITPRSLSGSMPVPVVARTESSSRHVAAPAESSDRTAIDLEAMHEDSAQLRSTTGPSRSLSAVSQVAGRRSERLEVVDPVVRRHTRRRAAGLLIAAAVLGIAGACVGFYLTRRPYQGDDHVRFPETPLSKTAGVLRIEVAPPDAVITIPGLAPHTGSPWSVELAPGIHQIEIRRDGFQPLLTSVDLVGGQRMALPIKLDPLDGRVIDSDATLIAETPAGYEVWLDNTLLPAGGAYHRPLPLGSHTLSLRKGGTELWQAAIDARASNVYDYAAMLRNAARTTVVTPAKPSLAAGSAGSDASAPPLPDNISVGSAVEPAAMPTTGTDQ